ncbi:hypothetical protein BX600DRAFT_242782 [Xylariales sp. PMI_506]|nr:hypothetical protein BX600DRAFT_242782 [Xylariales sp. PMI_506]
MPFFSGLLGLPATMLALVVMQIQAQQLPTAVKKMSLDEGEKIMPQHLAFAPQYEPLWSPLVRRGPLTPEEHQLLSQNFSVTLNFRPPFGILHGEEARGLNEYGTLWGRAKEALHRLQGRGFSCPSNTKSCESIGQPDYCCAVGETCFTVNDADAGNVGCCPDGETCGGDVGPCGNDSTSCSAEVGGGCCISGYVCAQVGCVASTVSVITMTSTSTTVISTGTPSTEIITVIVTVSPSVETTASTLTQTVTATTTTSTGTGSDGLPPFRATSGTGTTTTASTTATGDYCPTGFYACLATAGGGCCRTGRDCVTTSCPPVSSTTITSNGVTLVLPASDVPTATTTSTCAGGWFLCPSDAGAVAGCCPSGYTCGTASCTLSANSVTATVQKELPSRGSHEKELSFVLVVAIVFAGVLLGLTI